MYFASNVLADLLWQNTNLLPKLNITVNNIFPLNASLYFHGKWYVFLTKTKTKTNIQTKTHHNNNPKLFIIEDTSVVLVTFSLLVLCPHCIWAWAST